jgi:hypothetical protein
MSDFDIYTFYRSKNIKHKKTLKIINYIFQFQHHT